MSTKLTSKSPTAGFDLVDSTALALVQAASTFQSRMANWLLNRLLEDGFTTLTSAQLNFMGRLDCGPNHASNLARDLNISRQAVHKTVRELTNSGWLETAPDPQRKNQRVIIFTPEGERLMAAARHHFQKLDTALLDQFGQQTLDQAMSLLQFAPDQD